MLSHGFKFEKLGTTTFKGVVIGNGEAFVSPELKMIFSAVPNGKTIAGKVQGFIYVSLHC